jgi:hypothetical protein
VRFALVGAALKLAVEGEDEADEANDNAVSARARGGLHAGVLEAEGRAVGRLRGGEADADVDAREQV